MSNINLKEKLFNRFLQKKLASFYIIQHPQKEYLWQWAEEFIHDIIVRETGKKTSWMNHPDIVYMDVEDEDSTFDDLHFFNKYVPSKMSWKFFFLASPHLITESTFNKLLKMLEESVPCSSVFFLHYFQQSFLPTIQGRAIILRLPQQESEQDLSNIDGDVREAFERFISKGDNLDGLFETITRKNQHIFTKLLLDRYLNSIHHGHSYQKMLKTLQHIQETQKYHHSIKGQICLLLEQFGRKTLI